MDDGERENNGGGGDRGGPHVHHQNHHHRHHQPLSLSRSSSLQPNFPFNSQRQLLCSSASSTTCLFHLSAPAFSMRAPDSSMSTVSLDDNPALSSEDSSTPDDSDLDLGLGLSLSVGSNARFKTQNSSPRILTAKDFPNGVSAPAPAPPSSSSSSSSPSPSSSSLSRANPVTGTKRTADSAANGSGSGQVVGWPPIRAYRMNSMVNQGKATDGLNSGPEKDRDNKSCTHNGDIINGNGNPRSSLFVKVNMDGIPIGRKVDLNLHGSYEILAKTLEDMFLRPNLNTNHFGSNGQGNNTRADTTRLPKLLDGTSEFVLTYEDKDGDWMLVGDVPWRMFISSVKRLRIMRKSEATGLAPRSR